jgi:hypothetical protein
MNSKSPKLLVATAAVALVGAGAAIAAGSSTSSTAADEPFLSAVAKRVNVTPEALLSAIKAEATARVDAAEKSGKLPAEAAKRIRERIAGATLERPLGLLGPGARRGGPAGPAGPERHHGLKETGKAAADYLGLTRAELRAELVKGKSLAQIAKEQGKSVDGLKAAIAAEAKSHLDQAVADGKLTREQADELLSRLQEHLDDIVNRTPPARPAFGPGDRFGGGDRMGPDRFGQRLRRMGGRFFGARPNGPPVLPPLGMPAGA